MAPHTAGRSPEEPFHIAVIVGSLRQESTTRRIADAAIARAPAGMSCQMVDIGNLPHFNQDLEETPPQAWVAFRDRIAEADGALFFTPEYNRSFPGCLKNAIDIGSRPHGSNLWDGMPAGVVSVTPYASGGMGANHALRQTFVYLNMPAMQQPEAYIALADSLLDADGQVKNETTDTILRHFMQSFGDWVHLVRGRALAQTAPWSPTSTAGAP